MAPIAVYQPEESVPTRRKAGTSNPKSKPSHVGVNRGLNRVSPGGKKAQKADSMQSLSDQLSLTVRAGMPLSQLNIALLDTDTKLVLAEKEQALLGKVFNQNFAIFQKLLFQILGHDFSMKKKMITKGTAFYIRIIKF